MINLLNFGTILILGYVIIITLIVGLRKSISVTYYDLGNYTPVFTLVMWGFGLSVGIVAIELGATFMAISGIGVIMVGAAANYTDRLGFPTASEMAYKVHMGGSYLCVGGSMLGAWFDFGMWYIPVIFILASLSIRKKKNRTKWVEIFAIVLALFTLYKNLLTL